VAGVAAPPRGWRPMAGRVPRIGDANSHPRCAERRTTGLSVSISTTLGQLIACCNCLRQRGRARHAALRRRIAPPRPSGGGPGRPLEWAHRRARGFPGEGGQAALQHRRRLAPRAGIRRDGCPNARRPGAGNVAIGNRATAAVASRGCRRRAALRGHLGYKSERAVRDPLSPMRALGLRRFVTRRERPARLRHRGGTRSYRPD
jgi:hypothetical protein